MWPGGEGNRNKFGRAEEGKEIEEDVNAFEFRVGERAIVEFGRWSFRDQIASGKIDWYF